MRIQTLSSSFETYQYTENRHYDAIEDRFLRNSLKALDFLYRTNTLTITYQDEGKEKSLDIIDVLIADTQHNITIISGYRNAYNHRLNTILFLDTHGAKFRKNHKKQWFRRNRGFNSPVALLSHELIHCYNELFENKDYLMRKNDQSHRGQKIDYDGRDLSFPNAEEAFVIRMTNQVAKRLGEDKRSNYGRSYYPVEDVLSIKKKRKP